MEGAAGELVGRAGDLLARVSCHSDQLRIEGVSRDSGGASDDEFLRRERLQLRGEHDRFRRRDQRVQAVARAPPVAACESLEIKRIPAAGEMQFAQRHVRRAPPQQFAGLGHGQRSEPDRVGDAVPLGLGQRPVQTRGQLARAVRQDHRQPGLGRMPKQVVEQFDGPVVGPVHVVEDQDEPVRLGHRRKQRPHCAMQPEPFDVDQIGRPWRRRTEEMPHQ